MKLKRSSSRRPRRSNATSASAAPAAKPTTDASPPAPKRRTSTSSRSRYGSSSGAGVGAIAVPPGGSAPTISAFACATRSTVPSSSRCTGPTLVTTPMSGRATAQSAAIWPRPRIPISATTTSVSGSIRASVSGRPISLLWPPSAATVLACGPQSAARMSFVEVLPVEPVMPTTRAVLRARTAAADRRERAERVVGGEHGGGAAREARA